jgi:hypothetical protein
MKPLCSGINVSTNAGSNSRTSPDLLDQQKLLTGRSPLKSARIRHRLHSLVIRSRLLPCGTPVEMMPLAPNGRPKALSVISWRENDAKEP